MWQKGIREMEAGKLSKDDMMKLIEAGIQAPSADNMQPWRFRIDGNSLELSLDRNLMGLFFDPARVATELGCGALVENMRQMARRLGLALTVDFANSAQDEVVARLRFSAASGDHGEELSGQLFERCTDRELYRKKRPLTASERGALSNSVTGYPGHSLTFYDQPEQRHQFIHAVYQADTLRFSHPATHRDFHHVLRFGSAVDDSRDGLAQSTLGIEFFFIPVLRLLRPWGLTRLLNHIGLHHLMALRGVWLPMVTTPSLVSIVHTGPRDNYLSGQALQRFWLEATRLGLSAQPLGAFPLFLARLELLDGEGFTGQQITRLKALRQAFVRVTPPLQEGQSQLVMLFRVGHGRKLPGRSLRRAAETFLD